VAEVNITPADLDHIRLSKKLETSIFAVLR